VVRQAAQFLVQQWLQIGALFLRGLGVWHLRHLHFPRPPPGGGPPSLERRLVGDPVQPVPHRLPAGDGRRLADEDDEGGLEGVLGVVVAQLAAADAPHHRGVPVDEGGQGGLVAPIDVTTEQLAVAKPHAVSHHRANVLDHARRHAPPSASYLPHEAQLIHDFPRHAPVPAPERLHSRVSRRK